jgi:hypothetical protein
MANPEPTTSTLISITHRLKSFLAAECSFRDHHSMSLADSGQFFGSVSIELEKLRANDFPLKSETLARRIRTICPTDSFPKLSAFWDHKVTVTVADVSSLNLMSRFLT